MLPEGHFEELAALVLRDAPDEFACVGHSFGGYLALEIVRQAPERVTHLALISSQARADTSNERSFRRAQVATAEREGMHRLGLQLIDLVYPWLAGTLQAPLQ